MEIGDKVRFLNDVGGGVITGFREKNIVLVEDEDGFNIPIQKHECVIVGQAPKGEKVKQIPSKESLHLNETQSSKPKATTKEAPEGELITAVLAFLPINENETNETIYEAFLVNESNYFLNYLYLNRTEKGWMVRSHGDVKPHTQIFIDEFGKSELINFEKVCIQFTSYKKDKPFVLKNSFSIELKIDTIKFLKPNSFKENDYFEDDAIVYPLVRKDLPAQKKSFSAMEIQNAMIKKKDVDHHTHIQSIKKDESPVLEIDLHISELLDNTNGLSSRDMLEYQLKTFNEVMAKNLHNKGKKIIFIHGKGDGILKKTVLDELKKKYSKAYVQDASFREYGFGATMVTIK